MNIMEKQVNRSLVYLFTCIFLLVIIVLLSFKWIGNKPEDLQLQDYKKYINAYEDLTVNRALSEINYKCVLIPADFNAVKNLREDLADSIYKAQIRLNEGFVYFNVFMEPGENNNSILDPSKLDQEEHARRIKYFNSMAQNEFKLLVGNDSVDCSLYLFENPYNISNRVSVLLGFMIKGNRKPEDMTLLYNDMLFNEGPVRFYYSKNTIQNLPRLVIN